MGATTKSGWCVGPKGAKPPHERCKVPCVCECHGVVVREEGADGTPWGSGVQLE